VEGLKFPPELCVAFHLLERGVRLHHNKKPQYYISRSIPLVKERGMPKVYEQSLVGLCLLSRPPVSSLPFSQLAGGTPKWETGFTRS